MLKRSLRLLMLAAVMVAPLAGCVIVPYHHHRDYYRY